MPAPHTHPGIDSLFPGVPKANVMELRLRNFRQLFNSLDPSPFIEKDLDHEAEEFLISWAREIPRSESRALIVHLEEADPNEDMNALVASAIHNFFEYRARMKRQDMHEFFRHANMCLLIGLLVLTACFLAGLQIEAHFGEEAWGVLIRESLLIGGWVAMWRPLELFLYEWWPIRRMVRLFRGLDNMPIRVIVAGRS